MSITHPVTFAADDCTSLVVALQAYAIAQKQKGFLANAARHYELAATAALGAGWDQIALQLKNDADYCGHRLPSDLEG